jgi:transcriptional regulator with XRE-family HTH domain
MPEPCEGCSRLGQRVTEARQRLYLSKSELARRANLSPAAVWQIEKGERQPACETLRCLALGVSADWLLGISVEQRSGVLEKLRQVRALLEEIELA